MSFIHPYFLLALAGVAVPLVIHLLIRDRIQHVAFSTLRFFVKGAKYLTRRKKFQELLLILMRVAIVALLALVFARPFLKSDGPAGPPPESVAQVIVADVSGSMRRAGLPAALKAEAQAAVDSLRGGADAAALIAFADAPQVIVPFGSSLAETREAAAALEPGWAGTNIAEALRKANEILRGVRAAHKRIVLISDLQREGWRYFKGDWKLAGDIDLVVRAVKPADAGSPLAIVEAHVPQSLVLDRQPCFIAVRVANYSNEPCANIPVTLSLGGAKADAQPISIRANSMVAVRFRHVFDTPGDNVGTVTVGGSDSAFYFNARTIPRIPVLLVNGRPSSNPQADAAFFLEKALAPSAESPFAVKTVAVGKVTPADVAESMVTILANVAEVPAGVADALAALLARGGGLFFLPGDQVKPDGFNAQFGRLAPCKLRQVLTARPASGETAESLTRVDFEHPVFEVFVHPHHGDLSRPKFARYWETTDTQLSRVLARFGDGRPAILERQIGQGVAMAMVSPVDGEWNDFAYQSVFLPYLHQTVRYLAVRTEKPTGYASGAQLPVPEDGLLKDPGGKTHPIAEAVATEPGFYRVLNKDGKEEFTYAVNASLAESDPAAVAADEIAAAIERSPGEVVGPLDADTTATETHEKKDGGLWWYMLCGLLGLTLAELVLGNKALRH